MILSYYLVVLVCGISCSGLNMSDLHSAIIRPQQCTRWSGSVAQCDIIPEGIRHPPPGSTRGLVTFGVRPVEDLEASLLCLNPNVLFWEMFNVLVLFCVTSLTTTRTLTTGDDTYGIYKTNTKCYDSKD